MENVQKRVFNKSLTVLIFQLQVAGGFFFRKSVYSFLSYSIFLYSGEFLPDMPLRL